MPRSGSRVLGLLLLRLPLRVLLLLQLTKRGIHPAAGNHRLIVRIRLQLLLLLRLEMRILVALTPLVVGRASFCRIDIVLIGTLAAHVILAAWVDPVHSGIMPPRRKC